MQGQRLYWQAARVDREVTFEKPAGTWRIALLASIGLWGLIATALMQLIGA
ncbi:hypothetical protein BN1110_04304 [bacterium YEK0313]|nr:hypothetical protein BN1110_04304 [bacterium YEK0313]